MAARVKRIMVRIQYSYGKATYLSQMFGVPGKSTEV
jgi:hypothetical protein